MKDAELESEVRIRCEHGELDAAVEAAIRGYGPEVLGFLAALHGEQDAGELFSSWSVKVWEGLGGFRWECSLRTWVYTVARSVSLDLHKGARRRARHERPWADESAISRIEERVRTETRPYLRTQAKSQFARLRESLPEEDQVLLMLRVEKRLEWNELARVLLGDAGAGTEAELKRASQRLRKRFQILKDQLAQRVRQEGLLDVEGARVDRTGTPR